MHSTPQIPEPAQKVPHERTFHGDTFVDNYEWMRDKDSPQVRDYLDRENAYTDARTEHLNGLRERIFDEIRSRTKETDLSVPARRGDHWYFTRTSEGKNYPAYCRVPVGDADSWNPPGIEPGVALDGEEQLIDFNAEAGDSSFFAVGSLDVSPDGKLLVYAVDRVGDERFTLRIRNLETGEDLPDEIPGIFYGACFDGTGKHIYYTTVDDSWRPDTVWRHTLGASTDSDEAVFREDDERFFVGAELSRTGDYLFISTEAKTTSGTWFIPTSDPTAEPQPVWPREQDVDYSVEHAVVDGEDRFLIVHNRDRADFDIVDVPAAAPGTSADPSTSADSADQARRVLRDVTGMRIEEVQAFSGLIAVGYRRAGFARVGIIDLNAAAEDGVRPMTEIDSGEDAGYRFIAADNHAFDQPHVRVTMGSLVRPHTVADCTPTSTQIRKVTEVPGVDLGAYSQTLEWATAADGTQIPVSLVWRTDAVDRSGPAPLNLYGYGSYEASMDPAFSAARLSLLDRGVVFAIAHIRGGGEMGRHWYEQGRMEFKKNTFTDFIDVADHLISTGWTTAERMVARGGSAGGLLMGAVANMAPDRFAGIIADVPFVDSLTSMLMPELPLTVIEWEEWGDPLHSKEFYEYMRSYAPYENVTQQQYPPILAITSLNDTRVLYVEPAKWTARLREVGADVILKTDMTSGHGGASGRYDSWRETAFWMAWMLDRLGLAESGEQ